jgi:hypothetical protein
MCLCISFLSLDQERIYSSSSPTQNLITISPVIQNVRHPIKPRTMAQAQVPSEGKNDESLPDVSLDVSSDGDVTIVQKRKNL